MLRAAAGKPLAKKKLAAAVRNREQVRLPGQSAYSDLPAMWYSVRFYAFLAALLIGSGAVRAQAVVPGHPGSSALPAGACCVVPQQPDPVWMFRPVPASASPLGGLLKKNPLTGYAAGQHLRFMTAWRSLPTGLADRPDRPAGSLQARNSAYTLVGAGASYRLSHTLRATTNWATGVSRYSVSPGSQFTLGLSVKY